MVRRINMKNKGKQCSAIMKNSNLLLFRLEQSSLVCINRIPLTSLLKIWYISQMKRRTVRYVPSHVPVVSTPNHLKKIRMLYMGWTLSLAILKTPFKDIPAKWRIIVRMIWFFTFTKLLVMNARCCKNL